MEGDEGILPAEYLQRSPSSNDGISLNDEISHRIFGSEVIQESCLRLNLPLVVAATAQNLFHRYFYRKSLKCFDAFTVAMGCLLLATKIEEIPKTLRDILMGFHEIYCIRNKKSPEKVLFEIGGQRYNCWKNELITIERCILKELGFYFYNPIEHPHKYLLYYVRVLEGSDEIAKLSWNYLNDSMRIDLCLRYPARVIASAAIFMAAEKCNFSLPVALTEGSWWNVFDASLEDIHNIKSRILSLYSRDKVEWLDPLFQVDYLTFDMMEIPSPRQYRDSSSERSRTPPKRSRSRRYFSSRTPSPSPRRDRRRRRSRS